MSQLCTTERWRGQHQVEAATGLPQGLGLRMTEYLFFCVPFCAESGGIGSADKPDFSQLDST
eukprot:9311768-Alexandrium_andersonii.AAC.1